MIYYHVMVKCLEMVGGIVASSSVLVGSGVMLAPFLWCFLVW